jgi:hypothetical protein
MIFMPGRSEKSAVRERDVELLTLVLCCEAKRG